ncbi:unnamed protein product [Coffea canephora]|uniref:Uncharacterized protein n=1 Tax=Coffea canephora TaxID=49390 RepID=A0A068TW03_COFCA|nr:unnamed protein product [Coffea canephora]
MTLLQTGTGSRFRKYHILHASHMAGNKSWKRCPLHVFFLVSTDSHSHRHLILDVTKSYIYYHPRLVLWALEKCLAAAILAASGAEGILVEAMNSLPFALALKQQVNDGKTAEYQLVFLPLLILL